MAQYQVVNKETGKPEGNPIEASTLAEAEDIGLRNRDSNKYGIVEVLLG